MKKLLYILTPLLLFSCNKEKSIEERYNFFQGKWYWYKSDATALQDENPVYTNSENKYYYEFKEDRSVAIKMDDNLLAEGEMIQLELSEKYIRFTLETEQKVKYSSALFFHSDSLWYKLGEPGPLYPPSTNSLYYSYFKKSE